MSDREQLIRQIADEMHEPDSWEHLGADLKCRDVLDALDRLGYTVVPVTVPAEPPRITGDELEGSEATTGAERAIAEMIGWELDQHVELRNGLPGTAGHVGFQQFWLLPDGTHATGRPSVDDMLAWLRAKGYRLNSAWLDDCGPEDAKVDEYYAADFYPGIEYPDGNVPSGATLNAAVEAAVRLLNGDTP